MEDMYKLLEYSYIMRQKSKEKEKLLQSKELQEKRIAVLCGSTFGEIEEFLELFLLYYGIRPIFLIGGYNRFFEEACFHNNILKDFNPDIILIHSTNKNLFYALNPGGEPHQTLQEDKHHLLQIWKALEEQYHCTIIQNNCEYFLYRMIGNAARTHENGNVRYIDEINRFISSYTKEHKNFYVNDIHYLSSYVGLKIWNDDRMWNMYKYPMAMSVMPRYALSIANIIKSIFGKNKKTIITDLDNTLWGGIIGEVGVENIKLGSETPQGEYFQSLHRYLKFLSSQGVVLNICSKNEYNIGIKGIQSTKSILKEEDFAVKKINWKNKYENIKEIVEELNLAADSVVFMDDNPVECDSVKAMVPEIETLQMANVRNFLEKMDALSFFEITTSSGEDQLRNQYYKENIARGEEKRRYKDYKEYLNALHMICYVDRVHGDNIERVVQLLNKTNQFNFLAKRYTLEEITILSQMPEIKMFVLDVKDKFGSNGIVSIAIVRFKGEEAYIEGWVMSCRVFERGIELAMLNLICESCQEQNVHVLHGYYRETSKNIKIAHFFKEIGFEEANEDKENRTSEWVCRNIKSLKKRCKANHITMKQSKGLDENKKTDKEWLEKFDEH